MRLLTFRFIVTFLLIAICAEIAQLNHQRWQWMPNDESPAVDQIAIAPVKQALAIARQQKLPIVERTDGKFPLLQTEKALAVTRLNAWLQALSNEKIAPVTLRIRPATGEGMVFVETGFEKE